MKMIYVVLSATPSTIGKLIRVFTHFPYNHVSFSFDHDLKDMISFARYYYEMPFYGGFIHESIERYQDSNILLYEIPISEDDYERIKNSINEIEKEPEEYIYHTINALLCPFHKSINAIHAHTCASFTDSLLQQTSISFSRMYDIPQVKEQLEPYLIYVGSIHKFHLQSNPNYFKDFSIIDRLKFTFHQQKRLIKRIIKK